MKPSGGLASCKSSCRNLSSVSISVSPTISARSERNWRKTQMDASEFRNKLQMADFDLGNTAITSPVDGTVVGLNIFTQGASWERVTT